MSTLNPFTIAQQLTRPPSGQGLDVATHEFLRWPMREYQFHPAGKMDNGRHASSKAFVQCTTTLAGRPGGIRWHPEETIDTVRALAAWMMEACRSWTFRWRRQGRHRLQTLLKCPTAKRCVWPVRTLRCRA